MMQFFFFMESMPCTLQSTYHLINVPIQEEKVCLKVLPLELQIATSSRFPAIVGWVFSATTSYQCNCNGNSQKCSRVYIFFTKKKNHKFFDKSIYFWRAFESYCFHGHAENYNKCSYIWFF